jgi:hypothetical protein
MRRCSTCRAGGVTGNARFPRERARCAHLLTVQPPPVSGQRKAAAWRRCDACARAGAAPAAARVMCLPLWWLSRAVGALVGAVLGRCVAFPHKGAARPARLPRCAQPPPPRAAHGRPLRGACGALPAGVARSCGGDAAENLPPALALRVMTRRARARADARRCAPRARSALYQSGLEVTCGGQRDFRLWEGAPGHPRHLVALHRAAILFWDALDATGYRAACHRRERCATPRRRGRPRVGAARAPARFVPQNLTRTFCRRLHPRLRRRATRRARAGTVSSGRTCSCPRRYLCPSRMRCARCR